MDVLRRTTVKLLITWLTFLIAGLGFVARAEEPSQVRMLTLQECIERALDENIEIQIERVKPVIRSWNIAEAESAFDPALAGRLNYQDSSEPLAPERSASLGLGTLDQRDLQTRLSLTGLLPTGTRYELSTSDTRSSGTLAPSFVYTGTAGLSLTQPLLKNFGRSPNTAALRVARKDREIALEQVAARIGETIRDVSRAYFELVFAIEDHKAKFEDSDRAKALLSDNRKRVEIGVMSPLDVTQAEAGAAEREEAVIIAERAIVDSENALKRLIASDMTTLRGVTIRPADPLAQDPVKTDAVESVRTAVDNRPDLIQARRELERREVLLAFNRNQSLPEIDLLAGYGLNALGDSVGNYTGHLTGRDNPVWNVGVVATFPLGNRQAQAAYEIAGLDREQSQLTLRQLEQDVTLQVENTVGQIQSNFKRVEATRVAGRLAEESLKAEESKLRAGVSTSFLVLEVQSRLAAARSAEIRARTDYSESIVELERVEGTTLRKHGISLDDDPISH